MSDSLTIKSTPTAKTTIPPQKPSYIDRTFRVFLYSIVVVSSIFIGTDCAINAAFYLGQMSIISQFTIGIGIAAISGFLLNFLLYALDAPSVLAELPRSLLDDLKYFWIAFGHTS